MGVYILKMLAEPKLLTACAMSALDARFKGGFVEVYKSETREIIRRFLNGRQSFPECIAALDNASVAVSEELTEAQLVELRTLCSPSTQKSWRKWSGAERCLRKICPTQEVPRDMLGWLVWPSASGAVRRRIFMFVSEVPVCLKCQDEASAERCPAEAAPSPKKKPDDPAIQI